MDFKLRRQFRKVSQFTARRIGRTHVGAHFGTAWHRYRGRSLANDVIRLHGVRSVYLAGSSLERVALGYSDIDLVLFTDLPTLEDELRLRRELVPIVRRHNWPLEPFQHMDYIEVRDVELLQRFGHSYVLRQPTWEHLAGDVMDQEPKAPTQRHQELARVTDSVRFWAAHSHRMIRPWAHADHLERLRHSRRFLQRFIAEWLGLDRDLPLGALLETARPRATGETLLRLASDPSVTTSDPKPPLPAEMLAACLEILEAHVAEACRTFCHAWPLNSALGPKLEWRDATRLGDVARRAGFASAEIVRRGPGPGQHTALLTTATNVPAERAVSALERVFDDRPPMPADIFGKVTFPLLMTPALRNGIALFEPYPLVGVSLSVGAAFSDPPSLPPPAAPSATDLAILARMSLVQLLARARGRALRFTRRPGVAHARMAHDVFHIAPLLDALYEGRPADLSEPASSPVPAEAAIIEQLRCFLDDVRPRLRREL